MEDKRERWEWSIGRNGYKHLMSGEDYILSPESDLGDYGQRWIEWCDVSDEHARLIAAAPDAHDIIMSFIEACNDACLVESDHPQARFADILRASFSYRSKVRQP